MSVIKQRALMNKEYLAEYSLLPKNYNVDEVWNFLPLAETLHIVPIIGEDLYNELLDQVQKNEVTQENSSLLLKIYPFLGLAVMEVSMPYVAFHITEVGITKGKSDNSDSVDTDDINYLTNYIRSQMIPYKDQLVDYLNKNAELYPLYEVPECTCKITKPGRVYAMNRINVDVDHPQLFSKIWKI